jgi:hypothetical protein
VLYDFVDTATGRPSKLIDDKTFRIIMENKVTLFCRRSLPSFPLG